MGPFVQQRSGPRETSAAGGITAYGRGLRGMTAQLRDHTAYPGAWRAFSPNALQKLWSARA